MRETISSSDLRDVREIRNRLKVSIVPMNGSQFENDVALLLKAHAASEDDREELAEERVALSLALRGQPNASLEAMLEVIKDLCDSAGFNPAERRT